MPEEIRRIIGAVKESVGSAWSRLSNGRIQDMRMTGSCLAESRLARAIAAPAMAADTIKIGFITKFPVPYLRDNGERRQGLRGERIPA